MQLLKTALAVLLFVGMFVIAQQSLKAAPAAGPQAQHSAAPTKESKATVYIYRNKSMKGGALEPSVYCDDVELARMDNGRYFAVKLDPGSHVLHSNDKNSSVQLDLKAGQVEFVRVEIAMGLAKGHGKVVQMTPEQGKNDLQSKKLKPLDSEKVVDKARVSIEEAQFEKTGEAAK